MGHIVNILKICTEKLRWKDRIFGLKEMEKKKRKRLDSRADLETSPVANLWRVIEHLGEGSTLERSDAVHLPFRTKGAGEGTGLGRMGTHKS